MGGGVFPLVIAIVTFWNCSVVQAANATPDRMSYQGYLTDGTNPLASGGIETYDIIFRIYDSASTSNNLLWAEEQAVSVSNGSFSVLLGEGTQYTADETPKYSLLSDLFTPNNVTLETYVELTVDEDRSGSFDADETPIAPRLQLVTSPFAFMANTALELSESSVTVSTSEVAVDRDLAVTGESTFDGRVTIESTTDVSDDSTTNVGGLNIRSSASGSQMRIDTNEIQAVSNSGGTASKIHINHNGGDVLLGHTSYETEIQGNSIILDGTTTVQDPHGLRVAGNVGIGTDSPVKKLEVVGSAAISGSLGIGTTSPSDLLHLQGSGQVRIGLDSTGTGGEYWQIQSGGPSDSFTGGLSFIRDGGNRQLTIKQSGDVYIRDYLGVGTSSPAESMHVAGSGSPNIRIESTDSTGHAWNLFSGTGGAFRIKDMGTDGSDDDTRLFIDPSDGNTGIGNESPDAKLHVSASGDADLSVESTSSSGRRWTMQSNSNGSLRIIDEEASSGGTTRLHISTAGKIGIGTTSPGVPLHVASDNSYTFTRIAKYANDSNSNNGSITRNVSIRTDGEVVATEAYWLKSDQRKKELVRRSDSAEALRRIQELQVTEYRLRDKIQYGDSVQLGFFAQEVEQTVPEAVSQGVDFLPDIYAMASEVEHNASEETLTIRMENGHGLRVGDRVRLMSESQRTESEVVEIVDARTFIVSGWEAPQKEVFVFGREVDDFRTVDYDHIFTMGISALQEVNRKLDESNEQLRTRLTEVEDENRLLKESFASLMERVDALETQVAGSDLSDGAVGVSLR